MYKGIDDICEDCVYRRMCINGRYCMKRSKYTEYDLVQQCEYYINKNDKRNG